MKRGMTLTSLLVAVALGGIIAVFGGRLIVNQMFMAATAQLIDEGDTVMSFYVSALRDREVWRCTMFDSANEAFKKFVLSGGASVSGVSLRGPNCQPLTSVTPTRFGGQEWQNHPTLTDQPNLKRGDELIPPAPDFLYLGGSGGITEGTTQANGWWRLQLKVADSAGKGDVDLILKLCLQESVYTTKHKKRKQVPRSYRYKCSLAENKHMTRHIRYSENAIKDNCSSKAITSVGDRTGAGVISTECSRIDASKVGDDITSNDLLRFSSGPIAEYKLSPQGLSRPTSNRQAMKPIKPPPSPVDRHPIIGTSGTGELDRGLDRVLLHSLGSGTGQGESGGSECGYEYVNGVRLDLVVCGINNDGTIRCCSRKGPKGPIGLKGCPASKKYAVRGCIRRNDQDCPTLPRNFHGVPTCSSEQ